MILQQEGHIIRELREKYKCNQHDASCFISDERHIKLTAMHLQCWAKEIVIVVNLLEIVLLIVKKYFFKNIFLF